MFFPHFHINEVDQRKLKQAMGRCFSKWGLPRSIKVDNGKPFGDPQRTSVPELALWLVGLGIKVKWNAPRSPRQNAKVERMQATTAAWAEVQHCSSCQSLQRALDRVALIQREKYAVRRLKGKSRKQLYAKLWTNPRRYHAGSFDIGRVYHYLSKVTFKRSIAKNGCITFYGQKIYVGASLKSVMVDISFEVRKKQFRVQQDSGKNFAYFCADNFSEKAVRTLSICRYRTLSAAT